MTEEWKDREPVDDELLRHLRDDTEIRISTTKKDGDAVSVIIWSVVAERDAYVRSVNGATAGWYRRAMTRDGNGVEIDGRVHPVRLVPVDDPDEVTLVDDALRAKYAAGWASSTDAMLTPDARACTLRVQRAQV